MYIHPEIPRLSNYMHSKPGTIVNCRRSYCFKQTHLSSGHNMAYLVTRIIDGRVAANGCAIQGDR